MTGAGGPATDTLWQFWSDKYDLYFADQFPERIHPIIPKSRKVALPSVRHPNFYREIKAMVLNKHIDFVVTQIDEELLVLKKLEREIEFLKVLAPSEEFISLTLDKLKLGLYLQQLEILEPETSIVEATTLPSYFPRILKPRFGRGSRNIFRAESAAEFEALKNYLLAKQGDYICQSLIEGVEYTVQMISSEAGLLSSIAVLKIGQKRGSTVSAIVDNEYAVIQTCMRLHQELKGSATYNIQLMYVPSSSQIYIFEINPRVSTTMCVALHSGIDPIEIFNSSAIPHRLQFLLDGIRLERFTTNVISAE